jgi:hypothetical protein
MKVIDNEGMSESLLKSNPYLRDPAQRAAGLLRSAASSSAVEGIRKPFANGNQLTPAARSRKPAKSGG